MRAACETESFERLLDDHSQRRSRVAIFDMLRHRYADPILAHAHSQVFNDGATERPFTDVDCRYDMYVNAEKKTCAMCHPGYCAEVCGEPCCALLSPCLLRFWP